MQFAESGEKIQEVEISKGDDVKLYAVTGDDVGITVKTGAKNNVKEEINIDDNMKLPVEKGQQIGTMAIYEEDEKIAEYELVSDRNIKKADYITTYIRMIKKLI